MRILSIDIGGTNTRFADLEIHAADKIIQHQLFKFATKDPAINSFKDLISYYKNNKPLNLNNLNDYDRIALAVPGPVLDRQCLPPNIPWDINLEHVKELQTALMLNDFAAQGYACLLQNVYEQMELIKHGHESVCGRIAVIGAGTGLGHCCLVPCKQSSIAYEVVPSECGYATFSFVGKQEQKFGEFVSEQLQVPYCVNDVIVSGQGLSLLHEFLSGQQLRPDEIANNKEEHKDTLNLFSRFYARICRNYCLSNVINGKLIISGGITAKNPHLIKSDSFMTEFLNTPSACYANLLSMLPIYLNRDDGLGLLGAGYYAYLQHEQNA